MGTDSGCAMRQRIFILCSVKANPCEAFEALHGQSWRVRQQAAVCVSRLSNIYNIGYGNIGYGNIGYLIYIYYIYICNIQYFHIVQCPFLPVSSSSDKLNESSVEVLTDTLASDHRSAQIGAGAAFLRALRKRVGTARCRLNLTGARLKL